MAVAPGDNLPEPSPQYKRYLEVWSRSRRLIEQVVPEAGQPLEELDTRVFNTGRPPRDRAR